MGRPKNSKLSEKELANLKPCKPGETHNPNGRPPRLSRVIKQMPPDAQEKIYTILFTALTFKNVQEATAYIRSQDTTDFKYGFVLQLAVKALAGKNGWSAFNDILDRLFGKPRISAEVAHTGGITLNIQTDQETKDLIEGGLG